jgi:hypothetical protein
MSATSRQDHRPRADEGDALPDPATGLRASAARDASRRQQDGNEPPAAAA